MLTRLRLVAILTLTAVTCISAFTATLPPTIRRQSPKRISSLNAAESASTQDKQLAGRWEELKGNYILRPPMDQGTPRALVHFLGGALVGAVPHVSYRYMLERLADKGFLVVATPYSLSFDHLETCDAVIQRFETIAPMLAQQYGAVPVVGVGHSCGALLHLLITSLFPDTPRAANALVSFNNKPIKDAVPFFEEVSAFMAVEWDFHGWMDGISSAGENKIVFLTRPFLTAPVLRTSVYGTRR